MRSSSSTVQAGPRRSSLPAKALPRPSLVGTTKSRKSATVKHRTLRGIRDLKVSRNLRYSTGQRLRLFDDHLCPAVDAQASPKNVAREQKRGVGRWGRG